MRVLITGGCGFVGSALVKRLAKLGGFEFRILDNETVGKRSALGGAAYEFIQGDIRDRDTVDVAVAGVDAVVHLAADTGVMPSIADPGFNFDVNCKGSFNILEAMRAAGVIRLVSASTGGALLGDVSPPVHEEMVARPLSPYGASKLMVEGYCSAFSASYGMNAISLRFANVYGPGSLHKGSVVAAFFKSIVAGKSLSIYGDGEQTRDFIFVDDLCAGITAALAAQISGTIQLGSGRPLSVNALIAAMRPVVAPRAINVVYHPSRAGEVKATWCDISLAKRVLDFDPSTPLADGLAETWRWFLSQKVATESR